MLFSPRPALFRPPSGVMMLLLLALMCGCLVPGAQAQPPITIPCPVDCSVNSNVQAQVEACVKLAELCNPEKQVVSIEDFFSLLGVLPENVLALTPTNFIYQPTGEFVDRVDCTGLVVNDTDVNGTIIGVCIERFFCYTNPSTTINVLLSGSCSAGAFSFPAVLRLNYLSADSSAPAILLGGGYGSDPYNPTNVSYSNVIFNGGGTTVPFFADRMQNSNYSFNNVSFVNWQGDYMFKMEACIYGVVLELNNVYVQDVPGTPFWVEGLNDLRVKEYLCMRCAQRENAECFHVFMSPAATGNLDVLDSSCVAYQDLLPQRCRYCLGVGDDGFCGSRCDEGIVQVYDRASTAATGTCDETIIQFISFDSNTMVSLRDYDPTCRVYVRPTCNVLTLTDSQNFTNQIDIAAGDILWDEPIKSPFLQNYDAPLICVPGGTVTTDPPGPFFVSTFTNTFGDPIQIAPLPPLPPAPSFVDAGFETLGTNWLATKTVSLAGNPGALENIVKQNPRSGNYAFRTDQGTRRRLDQVVQVQVPGTIACSFYGARRSGQNEVSRWPSAYRLNIYINNVLVSSINGPQIRAIVLANDNYHFFNMPSFPMVAGSFQFGLEVNFLAQTTPSATLFLDDMFCIGIVDGVPDRGFEFRAGAWTGTSPLNSGIPPVFKFDDAANCRARTGTNRAVCVEGSSNFAQDVFFPNPGVFVVSTYAQRRNGASNFIGNFMTVSVNSVQAPGGNTLIEPDQLPDQDKYFPFNFKGRVIIPTPGTYTIRINCIFNNGNNVALCMDDMFFQAVGVIGVVPDRRGFSSGVLSSAPFIVNRTCPCTNLPPAPRDPLVLPCEYAINDQTVCKESVPTCCVQDYMVGGGQPLLQPVFWLNCSNLASSACRFLVNCQFDPTVGSAGQITNCRQFRCPNRNTTATNVTAAMPAVIPVSGQSDLAYFLANCTELFPQIESNVVLANSTLVAGITVTSGNNLVYPPSLFVNGAILVDTPEPFAYFGTCGNADDEDCQIFAFCQPLIVDPSQPNGYRIPGCSRLDCVHPSGLVLSTINQFWNCNVTETGITLTGIDGGWQATYLGYNVSVPTNFTVLQNVTVGLNTTLQQVIITRNVTTPAAALATFDAVAHAQWFQTWYVELQQTSISATNFSSGGSAVACLPFAFFRRCPCNASGTTYQVPFQVTPDPSNPLASETPPDSTKYYTCTGGVSSCDCDTDDASNGRIQNGTVGFNFVNAPDSLRRFRVFNNRAQQYATCIAVQQVSMDLVANNSLVIPQRSDALSVIRTVLQNDNQFVSCRDDGSQGLPKGIYSGVCDVINPPTGPRRPCALDLTDPSTADCTVNSLAVPDLPGFGVTIFADPAEAILAPACNSIYIMGGGLNPDGQSTYYETEMVFDKTTANMVLWSIDEPKPVIVGSHQFATSADNITLVGLYLIHPADNRRGLFSITKANSVANMERFTISNCVLDGGGCRKCGIMNTARLNNLVITDSIIQQWTFFMLKLTDSFNVNMTRNRIQDCTGRVIQVGYSRGFVFDQNTFVDVRGQDDLSGTYIISMKATLPSACNRNGFDFRCLFRQQVQIVNNVTLTTELFRDGCFYLSGGQIKREEVYDNACTLAQKGMVIVKAESIATSDLTYLMGLNPRIRPSLKQRRDDRSRRAFWGPDWQFLKLQSGSANSVAFNSQVRSDTDTNPYFIRSAPAYCRSNYNWDPKNGFGLGLFWPREGWERFHNASSMLALCVDRQIVFDDLGLPIAVFTGRVTSDNGSRITLDVLNFDRNGTLTSDDSTADCKNPNFKAAIEGGNHNIRTQRLTLRLLTFYMPTITVPADQFNCVPQNFNDEDVQNTINAQEQIIPRSLIIDQCEFNGRGILPQQGVYALDCVVGTVYRSRKFRPSTSALPPFTTASVSITNCLFENYVGYNQDGAPGGGDFLSDGFPHAKGIRVRAFNRRNTNTTMYMRNNTFAEMDFGAMQVLYFTNTTVEYSRYLNCSGRSYGNYACVFVLGNKIDALVTNTRNYDADYEIASAPSYLLMRNLTHLNTVEMLFTDDGKRSNSGLVVAYSVRAYPNTTRFYCLINMTSEGLSGGLRQDNTFNGTFLECPLFDSPPVVNLPDRPRILRAQCIAGNLQGIRGRVHDMIDGAPTYDRHGESIWCDSDSTVDLNCCPLVDPNKCFVTQSAALLQPGNPLLGTFIFSSLNFAIINCSAASRVIDVLGSADPFLTGDTSDKIYTEIINVQVPLISVVGVGGPLLIEATAGVTFVGSGHRIDTQCLRVTISGFTFEATLSVGVAVWEQTAVPACNLRWTGCRFTTIFDAPLMNIITSGDNVKILNSRIQGRDSGSFNDPRRGIIIRGTCTESFITIQNCKFRDLQDSGFDVLNVVHYVVAKNDGRNVGGKDISINKDNFGCRVGDCAAPPQPPGNSVVRFAHNRWRTTQTSNAIGTEKMRVCRIESYNRGDKRYDITYNDCRGMDIGLGIIDADPPFDISPPDRKAEVRGFAITRWNIRSRGLPNQGPLGERFDIVYGQPVDDSDLFANPDTPANKGRWCQRGCPTDQLDIVFIIAGVLGALALLALALCCVTNGCVPPRYRQRYYDANMTQRIVLREPVEEGDPGTGGTAGLMQWREKYINSELFSFKHRAAVVAAVGSLVANVRTRVMPASGSASAAASATDSDLRPLIVGTDEDDGY